VKRRTYEMVDRGHAWSDHLVGIPPLAVDMMAADLTCGTDGSAGRSDRTLDETMARVVPSVGDLSTDDTAA
jgi:hypothetical protein